MWSDVAFQYVQEGVGILGRGSSAQSMTEMRSPPEVGGRLKIVESRASQVREAISVWHRTSILIIETFPAHQASLISTMPPPRLRLRPLRPLNLQSTSRLIHSSTSHPLRPSLRIPSITCPSRTQTRTLRSIVKPAPRPSRFNTALPPLGASPASALRRKQLSDTLPLRTGALAIKKGMTAIYDPVTAERMACTVLQIDLAQVVGHKTRKQHGYFAVQIGSGHRLPKNVGKAMMGVFAAAEVSPKKEVREFPVRDMRAIENAPVGRWIGADWFKEGQFVDVRGVTRGMGFAGVCSPLQTRSCG